MAWNRPSEDGRARSPSAPRRAGTARPTVRGAIAGAVVVLGAAVAAWWLWPERDTRQDAASTKRGLIKEVTPAAAPKAKPAVVAEGQGDKAFPEKWDDSFVTNHELRLHFSKLVSATTAECGVVTERWRMPNGKYWRHQVDPPPIFDNPSDNAIARVLGDRSGAPMPPCPELDARDLNDAFVKSLVSPIEINEDDKPWVVALKLSVKEARSEIARLIKEGDTRSVGEILRDHLDENNRQAELRGDALKGYYKTLGESGEEAAAEYLNKVNKALEKFGVSPIKTNPQTERRSSRK